MELENSLEMILVTWICTVVASEVHTGDPCSYIDLT